MGAPSRTRMPILLASTCRQRFRSLPPPRACSRHSSSCWIFPVMRDGRRKNEPLVLALRPDRARRRRKARIGKRAHRDADYFGRPLAGPRDRRAAVGTELKGEPGAAIGLPPEAAVLALGRHDLAALEEGGRAEDRPGAALAGLAVAGRHPVRLASQPDPQLPAGTRRFALAGLSHRPDLPGLLTVTNWKLDPLW